MIFVSVLILILVYNFGKILYLVFYYCVKLILYVFLKLYVNNIGIIGILDIVNVVVGFFSVN